MVDSQCWGIQRRVLGRPWLERHRSTLSLDAYEGFPRGSSTVIMVAPRHHDHLGSNPGPGPGTQGALSFTDVTTHYC